MARFNLAEALRVEIARHEVRTIERATVKDINLVAKTVNVSLRGSPSQYRNVPTYGNLDINSLVVGDVIIIGWEKSKPLVIGGPI